MRGDRDTAGAVVALGLGLANLAWVNVALVPRYLDELGGASVTAGVSELRAPEPTDEARTRAEGALVDRAPEEGALAARAPEESPGVAPRTPSPAQGHDSSPKNELREATPPAAAPTAEIAPTTETRARAERADPPTSSWVVRFGTNRSDIGPAGRVTLEGVARWYRRSGGRIRLVGHTDPSGSARFNLDLSRRRARRVGAFLEGEGVPGSSLRIRARGEQGELPEGVGPRDWAARRRVDVTWIGPEEATR